MQLIDDDIRAEVLVAFWLENQSTTLDDVIIKPEGTFRRSYSKDVLGVELPNSSKNSKITIPISRDGLYDMLPEGLFHQAEQKNVKSTKEATEETKRFKREEKAARNLFLPLEQEFYRQRIWLDNAELKYWLTSTQPETIKALMRFWKLNPKHFNQRQSLSMLSMLPHLHKIVGDLQLTARSLEVIIDEKVQIKSMYSRMQQTDASQLSYMGTMVLGADAVLGTSWFDDEPSVQVLIGPVERKKLAGYLPDGKQTKLLSTLYGFFFPVEIEIETTVHEREEENAFYLTDLESSSLLGYSTFI